MRGPSIYVVFLRTSGDHETFVAWYFDEKEARDCAKANGGDENGSPWFSVEEVPAPEPIIKERW